MSSLPCPCDPAQSYVACCAPYHRGQQRPGSALVLMRSRYSAYALGLVDYIIKTTHRDNPQFQADTASWQADLLAHMQQTDFQQLKILDTEEYTQVTAAVTFEVQYAQNGSVQTFREKSQFIRQGKQWLYLSGE